MPLKFRELVRLMEAHGWNLDRISGGHYIMEKPGRRPVPVPFHKNRELTKWMIAGILKQAGIEKEI